MIVTATAADHCGWQAVILRADSVPIEKQTKGCAYSSLSPPAPSACYFWIINILDHIRLERHFRQLEIKAIGLVDAFQNK